MQAGASRPEPRQPSAHTPVAIALVRLFALLHRQPQILICAPSVPIAKVGVIHLVLLGQEGVAVLERQKLVQGGEQREERPSMFPLPFEVRKSEDALIEVLHLVVSDATITIEVKHVEPVLHRPVRLPVLVAEQEADEVLVAHLPRHSRGELRGELAEDAVDRAAGERVPIILEQVVFVQKEVVVRIQFPEGAVDYVEVLVAEVVADHLDVVMVRELLPSLGHGRLVAAKTVQMDAPNVLAVINEEDSTDHRVCVAVLELLGFPEEV
mmetsp:Transcript_71349/g.172665  ORF Transcript_71349/g.172665 Transcript_71349/m.172665 type:complete len:267 (+) Transcript_71349:108-908(+)